MIIEVKNTSMVGTSSDNVINVENVKLQQENEILKKRLEISEKAINDARMYVCRVGMKSIVGIHEWFIKDLLKILSIDKGE